MAMVAIEIGRAFNNGFDIEVRQDDYVFGPGRRFRVYDTMGRVAGSGRIEHGQVCWDTPPCTCDSFIRKASARIGQLVPLD
jgi:hypothetical protein